MDKSKKNIEKSKKNIEKEKTDLELLREQAEKEKKFLAIFSQAKTSLPEDIRARKLKLRALEQMIFFRCIHKCITYYLWIFTRYTT